MAPSIESSDKVVVYEDTLQLPTYALKGENPNPVFRSQYGVAHIYPYTLLDDVSRKPVLKRYRILILENRYLRVTVIPDLGGRVYSVYDKLSQREVFYKNKIVKFSPLAIRGAFYSGGVEFSFPVAHAPTTADPVNWDLRENEDGSASISIGGLEHISRLRWMITLTLYPDRCALAQDVQLYNPYTIPGRYHYWTNASLDADDRTEFVYPLRRVRSYEFAGTASWPIARLDLILKDPGLPGMEGVPMWPADRMREPVSFLWQKNMLAQVSIFGRNVDWDFFGAWQHSSDHGYAHFADHRDVAGMKLWSWGNAGVGVVNQSALTDDGSVYAETQCGAMETQLDFAFLQPGKTRAWREWWIPLRKLGGLTCASAEAGARITLAPAKEAGKIELTVGVCPSRDLGSARVELSVPGQVLFTENTHISPEQPWLDTKTLEAADLSDYPLHLQVFDQAGLVTLDHVLDREPSPSQPGELASPVAQQNSRQYYELGLKYENFDNREQAQWAYHKAIELSAENGEAHLRLGLMLLRAAEFSGASAHFKSAVAIGLLEANYYLGLLGLFADRLEVARHSFRSVPADSSMSLPAMLGLGMIALRQRDWLKAIGLFKQASLLEKKSITAALLMGAALRRAGQPDEARREFQWVLRVDPLNHLALRELAQLDSKAPYQEKLARLLADDRQYILDLACNYTNLGLLEDALQVLEEAAQTWQSPMVYYMAAYLSHAQGRSGDVQPWLQKASEAGPGFTFPSRLEEVKALQFALDRNPHDHKARYYLGTFFYAHQRFEEGVHAWQESIQGLSKFDVLYRNLGLAAWQRDQDLPLAIELFEKALALNPQNQDLYLHLDDLYKAEGSMEERQQLLDRINALSEVREDIRKRRILILIDLGRYEEALDIMQSETFVPLEMDQSFHNLYVKALMQRAEAHSAAGQVEKAITDYREALEFPENLGVGQPLTLSQAQIYYHLGLAYEKQGRFREALVAWRSAACEHHPSGTEYYNYVQMSLDKLSRYSELGLEV